MGRRGLLMLLAVAPLTVSIPISTRVSIQRPIPVPPPVGAAQKPYPNVRAGAAICASAAVPGRAALGRAARLSRIAAGGGARAEAVPKTRVLDGETRANGLARSGAAGRPAARPRDRTPRAIVVPVRFHVVTAGRAGRVPAPMARRQIDRLNAAFGGRLGGVDTRVSFRLAGLRTVDNARWFHRPRRYERSMLRTLREGGPGTLNLVTAGVGADLLGFSTFPQSYRAHPERDGVVVDYRTLPDGGMRDFNRGLTAVHETGHWLGLFHTFENGCARPGDHVDDTPYEAAPATGCPPKKDTCPRAGSDPVHNFMNYSRDACMREFSRGQSRRIRELWGAYRTGRAGSVSGAGRGAAL